MASRDAYLSSYGGRLIGPRAAANGRLLPTESTATKVLGTVSPERRLASMWFGTGYRTKVRAWDEAVVVARAHAKAV